MRWLAAALLALGACDGTLGTVSVDLTTAPGSTILDGVERIRLTLTQPPQVDEAERNANGGFDLSMSFEANGDVGALVLEGFDADGALVATGETPPFPTNPTNAHVVIYVAAPLSIDTAPVALAPVRSHVAGVAMPYGALFAGGRDAQDAPSDAIAIYNAYDHTLAGGLPMPEKRTDFALGSGGSGGVYLIGGTGADGSPVATVERFDTTVQPAGGYTSFGEQPAFARTGEIAVPIAAEQFLVTGTPPGELASGQIVARTDVAALPAVGASLTPSDGVVTAVFVGETGLVRFRGDKFDMLPAGGRLRAAIAADPATGMFIVAGGGTPTAPLHDILVVDPVSGDVTPHVAALATGRFAPAIAATDRYIVVAGGVDAADTPIPTAEVFDAATLAPVGMLPVAARTGALAFALPNGQVLIAGGSPATDLIELFTPPPRDPAQP